MLVRGGITRQGLQGRLHGLLQLAVAPLRLLVRLPDINLRGQHRALSMYRRTHMRLIAVLGTAFYMDLASCLFGAAIGLCSMKFPPATLCPRRTCRT